MSLKLRHLFFVVGFFLIVFLVQGTQAEPGKNFAKPCACSWQLIRLLLNSLVNFCRTGYRQSKIPPQTGPTTSCIGWQCW
jgi:hypothetical protein